MEAIIIKYLVEYGILGILGFFFIKQQNKNSDMVQKQYEKLVDNIMSTQKETLEELKKSIDSLVIIVKTKIPYETYYDRRETDKQNKLNRRDFSND